MYWLEICHLYVNCRFVFEFSSVFVCTVELKAVLAELLEVFAVAE